MSFDPSRYQFSSTRLTLVAGANRLARADSARVYLGIVRGSFAGSIWVDTGPGVGLNDGIQMDTFLPRLEYFWHLHGSLVTSEFWGISVNPDVLVIQEVIELPTG